MMKVLILGVLLGVVTCKIIRTKNCLTADEKETSLRVKHFELKPCHGNPCILKKGGSTELRIAFTANQDEGDLVNECYGKVGPIWVPFPLKQRHACKDQGICPIKAGKS